MIVASGPLLPSLVSLFSATTTVWEGQVVVGAFRILQNWARKSWEVDLTWVDSVTIRSTIVVNPRHRLFTALLTRGLRRWPMERVMRYTPSVISHTWGFEGWQFFDRVMRAVCVVMCLSDDGVKLDALYLGVMHARTARVPRKWCEDFVPISIASSMSEDQTH